MAVDVYEALEALFGASSSSATDEHVSVFLREGVDVSEDDADDNGVKGELEESFQFCLKPDDYIAANSSDPRVPQWEKIRDALRSTSPGPVAATPPSAATPTPASAPATPASTAAPTAVPAVPATTATPPSTSPPPPPAHARTAASSSGALGVPVGALSGPASPAVTPGPTTTSTPPAGGDKGKKVRRKKDRGGDGTGSDRDTKPSPRYTPPRVRGSGIPTVTRRLLETDRYKGFLAAIKTSADKLKSRDGAEKAQGRREMASWKKRAARYRDGQVRNTQADKDLGALLLRLIQSFETSKDTSDPDWFEANFVSGTYPEPEDE